MKLSIVFTALLVGVVTAAPVFVDCENEADESAAAATGLRCRNNSASNVNSNGNTNNANNANANANGNQANTNSNANGQGDDDTNNVIGQLTATFDRNNPNGTPAAPGDPDDLNGDGVINIFEAGAQAS